MSSLGFIDILTSGIERCGGVPVCVGLDPHWEEISVVDADVRQLALNVQLYCFEIIEQTFEFACCYKPNVAFFEMLGSDGVAALKCVCDELRRRGVASILDCKRGDISSTAEAYASAAFSAFGCDAVTVNPYMGSDSVKPFMDPKFGHPRGIFVLCKTSNAGSNDFQTLQVSKSSTDASCDSSIEAGTVLPLYLHVAAMCDRLNAAYQKLEDIDGQRHAHKGQERGGCVGVVVGATDVEAVRNVRSRHPSLWILAPGIGFQGGDLDAVLNAGLRKDGTGLILPISRAISRAPNRKLAIQDFCRAVQEAKARILTKPKS